MDPQGVIPWSKNTRSYLREIWEENPVPTGASEYREEYQEAYPDGDMDKIWVHHAKPLALLKWYPHLFSWHEINTPENYRGILKIYNREVHLSQIGSEWKKFRDSHRTATRDQVMELVNGQDRRCGHLYLPKKDAEVKFYRIDPETAGDWGRSTEISNMDDIQSGREHIAKFAHLEFEFTCWLGDDIVSGSDCYLVTKRLAEEISREGITGAELKAVHVTIERQFPMVMKELLPGVKFPSWTRLIPVGKAAFRRNEDLVSWSGDDCCWGSNIGWIPNTETGPAYEMVVTDRFLELLSWHWLDHCEIVELKLARS